MNIWSIIFIDKNCTKIDGINFSISLLPFPSTDDVFVARAFTEHLIESGRIDVYAIDKRGSRF